MHATAQRRDPGTYERRRERLGAARHPVFYLAIPPSMFDVMIGGLMGACLHDGARVVVEKPFGRDLASARELNECLHRAFGERAIYRIDHYLGKQTVQNHLLQVVALLAIRETGAWHAPEVSS